MKAMVLAGPGRPLELRDVPVPTVGPNDVLVRVLACGVGLTLIKGFASGRISGYPRIPGHEICGTVTAVGAEVGHVKVGQRVTCHYYLTCGQCRFCHDGRESLCVDRRGSVGRDIDGGYAEYVRLPARNVIPVPDGVDDVAAAIASDAIATPYHACREASLHPGDTVLVIGAGGGVGIHVVQMARLHSARVLGADIGEEKLALARELGADETIDARSVDIAERARSLTGGRGVDAAIDLVGSASTLRAALDSLGMGGRLVLVMDHAGN
jgi:propanol-preferring alcohol dehydrogenase